MSILQVVGAICTDFALDFVSEILPLEGVGIEEGVCPLVSLCDPDGGGQPAVNRARSRRRRCRRGGCCCCRRCCCRSSWRGRRCSRWGPCRRRLSRRPTSKLRCRLDPEKLCVMIKYDINTMKFKKILLPVCERLYFGNDDSRSFRGSLGFWGVSCVLGAESGREFDLWPHFLSRRRGSFWVKARRQQR